MSSLTLLPTETTVGATAAESPAELSGTVKSSLFAPLRVLEKTTSVPSGEMNG
ncbi:MAG: hypothetical protein ACLP36_12800 [Acidimicrobiales bacterium]